MRTLLLVVASVLSLGACHSAPKPHEVTPALERLLAGQHPAQVAPADWTQVRAFYTQRDHVPSCGRETWTGTTPTRFAVWCFDRNRAMPTRLGM